MKIGEVENKKGEKYTNLSRILNLLFHSEPISRVQMSRQTGLTRAAVGVLIEDLIEKNLVMETGSAASSGGRPPVLLQPNREAAFVIGAAMFDYSWAVVLTDLGGKVVDNLIVKIPGKDAESAAKILGKTVKTLKQNHKKKKFFPYIGVGAPGLVSISEGIIISAADLGWEEISFGEMILKSTEMIPTIVNRSKVSALTTYRLQNEKKEGNIISVVIGTGIAAGLILNHKLYMGSSSGAGELGHTSIIPNGPLCQCGNRGCLQSLVSEDALLERGRSLAVLHNRKFPENIQEIFNEASHPEEFYYIVLLEAAEYLSIAIGNLINLLNPQIVVLSGPIISGSVVLADLIRQKISTRAMKHNLNSVRITTSKWGNETAAIGSALLILEHPERYLLSKDFQTES